MMNVAHKTNDYNSDPRTLIVGLGQTGLSVARFLIERGHSICVADDRATPPKLAELYSIDNEIEVVLGTFDAGFFCNFASVILSPGVARSEEAVQAAIAAGVDVLGDVELYARHSDVPVIAITGSNGKSTVTQLVADMLIASDIEAIAGGNIGVPVLDLLSRNNDQWHVLELSSFQLESTQSLAPYSAVVLNISADHMDRYESLDDYTRAKRNIYTNAKSIVVNEVDSSSVADTGCHNIIQFGLNKPCTKDQYGICNHDATKWLCRGTTPLVSTKKISLQGEHNWLNILAAFALIESAGITLTDEMVNAAVSFSGLAHRMELIRRRRDVNWINDSKGTNVGATIAALSGLNAPVILIAGGQAKDADLTALAIAAKDKVKHAYLIGEDAEKLSDVFKGVIPVTNVKNLQHAIDEADVIASAGDVVLFSPACASFDMFQNFEHRGDVFRDFVQALDS